MAMFQASPSMLSCFGFLIILLSSISLAQEACPYSSRGGVGRGVCRDIRQCPSVIEDLKNRVRFPVSCGRFNGRFPVVCCPADSGSGNPSEVHDISPPLLSFECGTNKVIPETGIRQPQNPPLARFGEASALPDDIRPPPEIELVGGQPSFRAAWPWMALLGSHDSTGTEDWFCAGVLINEQWILTASHCLNERRVTAVRLGEHDLENPNDGATPQDFDVEASIMHPDYTFPQAYHDIALVKLARKVRLQTAIQPVCLPWGTESTKNLVGQTVTLTGWGDTAFGGSRSPVLQQVQVSVFPSEECDNSYKSIRDYQQTWPKGIGAESVCAGDRQGGKDACQGDSGGPIVSRDSKRRYTIAGVVSLGYGCGSKLYPGIYVNTRKSEYLAWIKKVAF